MNIRLAREQQRQALTLLRELSMEEQGMLEQVEQALDSMGLTLPEVKLLFSHATNISKRATTDKGAPK